jgi:hypothetical protein
LLINAIREKVLKTRILSKRDVWAEVKHEIAFVPEGRRVATMVAVLVVHCGREAFRVEPVSSTEAGHSSS